MRLTVAAFLVAVLVGLAGIHGAFAQYTSPSPSESPGISPSPGLYNPGTYVNPSPAVSTTPMTPGLPNTGDGGNAASNLALMFASGLVVLGGVTYLVRSYHAGQ